MRILVKCINTVKIVKKWYDTLFGFPKRLYKLEVAICDRKLSKPEKSTQVIFTKFINYFTNNIKLALSLSFGIANQNVNDMNNSTQKSIRGLSIAILVIGGLTLIYTYFQMVSQLWLNNFITPIVWNPEIKGWQIFILAARYVGVTLLFVLCCIFLCRTNKGLKEGEIFPKSNISLIRWTALVAALLAFVHSNYNAVVKGESEFMLDSNTILIPLIVLLFAGLYKMAYLAAKDSKLAI